MRPAPDLPVVVVAGVAAEPVAAAAVAVQWDRPGVVVLRHDLDPDAGRVVRRVSDAGGVVEHREVALEHDCLPCTLRLDLARSVERLAARDRWDAVLVLLPPGTEPERVVAGLAGTPGAAVTALVVAADASAACADVLGDDLLRERSLHSFPGDGRGVGEVLAEQVERADLLVVTDRDAEGEALLATLARPGAGLVVGTEALAWEVLTDPATHRPDLADAWCAPTGLAAAPVPVPPAWRLDLRSDRPFHPERLLSDIASLGGGPHRSRGCFWLPTRPHSVGVWAGAGGQLSVGTGAPWSGAPHTRITVVGSGEPPADLAAAFDDLLVTETEWRRRGPAWEVLEDGFEPWLGPIRRAARPA